MIKGIIWSVTCLAMAPLAYAQPTYQRLIGQSGNQHAWAVVSTEEKGVLVLGTTNGDLALVRVDSVGSILWSRVIDGVDLATCAVQNPDSGFSIIGSTTSFGSGNDDFTYMRTDKYGQLLASKVYGTSSQDRSFGLIRTPDGNLLFSGDYQLSGGFNDEGVLTKIDPNGNVLWHKVYTSSGSNEDKMFRLVYTMDGGIVSTGTTDRPGLGGTFDADLLKVDPVGNVLWSYNVGGSGRDHPQGLVEAVDSGFYLLCHTQSWGAGGFDVLLIKTDRLGNIQWGKTYGTPSTDYSINMLLLDDGLALCGYTNGAGFGGVDIYLIRTDLDGNVVWAKTYGSSSNEVIEWRGYPLCQFSDGGFGIVATTTGLGAVGEDMLLIRTDSLGNSGCNEMPWSPAVQSVTPQRLPVAINSYSLMNVVNPNYTSAPWITNCDFQCSSTFIAGVQDTLSLCDGDTIILNSPAPGSNFSWSPTFGLSDTTSATTLAFPNQTTEYTLTMIGLNGCPIEHTFLINVVPLATLTSPDTTICFGDTVQILATGGVIYGWSPATFLSDPQIQNPFAYPDSTTTFYVIVTDSGGCTGLDSVTITISTGITAQAGPDTSVCLGDSVQITASGGINYTWTPGSSLSDSAVASPLANPSTTTSYVVEASNGCFVSFDTLVVVVNPVPPAAAEPDTFLCDPGSIQLHATGGLDYLWNPSGDLSDPFSADPVATVSTTTTYTVSVTDSNGCVGSDSIMIAVSTFSVQVSADTAICLGDSAYLSASLGVAYAWAPTASLDDPTASDPVAFPGVTTDYTVIATDANGCSDTATIVVTIEPPPSGVAWPDTAICPGDTARLHASGGDTYSWFPSSMVDPPNSSDPWVSPPTTTTYGVAITGVCGSDTQFVTVTVQPDVLVDAQGDTTIYPGGQALLSGFGNGSFYWQPEATLSCNTCPNPIATPTETTTYYLVVTDNAGCLKWDSVIVFVEVCLGVHIPNAFTPNADGINDEFIPIYLGNFQLASFDIYSRWGQLLFSTNNPGRAWDGTFRGREQDVGVYAWVLQGECNGASVLQSGNVTLLR